MVKWIVTIALFTQTVAGLCKQHVEFSIDECRLTELPDKIEKIDETGALLLSNGSSSDVTEINENTLKCKRFNHGKSMKKKCLSTLF